MYKETRAVVSRHHSLTRVTDAHPCLPLTLALPTPRPTSRKKGTLASGLAAPPMHATVALRIYNYSIGSGEELAALVSAGARFFAGPLAYARTAVPTTMPTPRL